MLPINVGNPNCQYISVYLFIYLFQVVHDGVTPHQCSHCEAAFCYKDQLRIHIKRNHEGAEIPPKIAKRKEPWKNENAKKPERVSCMKCEKSFSSKIFLANHMLLTHEKVKYFKKNFFKPFILFSKIIY